MSLGNKNRIVVSILVCLHKCLPITEFVIGQYPTIYKNTSIYIVSKIDIQHVQHQTNYELIYLLIHLQLHTGQLI